MLPLCPCTNSNDVWTLKWWIDSGRNLSKVHWGRSRPACHRRCRRPCCRAGVFIARSVCKQWISDRSRSHQRSMDCQQLLLLNGMLACFSSTTLGCFNSWQVIGTYPQALCHLLSAYTHTAKKCKALWNPSWSATRDSCIACLEKPEAKTSHYININPSST